MWKSIALFASFVCAIASLAGTKVTDSYDFKASIRVPRVYDNMESLGYRKYQRQTILGTMLVSYCVEDPSEPTIEFSNMVNKTHRTSTGNVRYSSMPCERVSWHCIGSNKKGLFKTPSVSFKAELEPSYNIAQNATEDNSLFLYFSGAGSMSSSKSYRGTNGRITVSSLSGRVVGTIGCGCTDYGHVSPTRLIGPFMPYCSVITDVASVDGTWVAKFNKSQSGVVEK